MHTRWDIHVGSRLRLYVLARTNAVVLHDIALLACSESSFATSRPLILVITVIDNVHACQYADACRPTGLEAERILLEGWAYSHLRALKAPGAQELFSSIFS